MELRWTAKDDCLASLYGCHCGNTLRLLAHRHCTPGESGFRGSTELSGQTICRYYKHPQRILNGIGVFFCARATDGQVGVVGCTELSPGESDLPQLDGFLGRPHVRVRQVPGASAALVFLEGGLRRLWRTVSA